MPQIEHWALIDLAVREFDHVTTEVGSDVFEAVDDAFAALGVNLDKTLPAALETLALVGHGDSPFVSCERDDTFRITG